MRHADPSHVTLRMVAQAAGVSISTASRVMNDAESLRLMRATHIEQPAA